MKSLSKVLLTTAACLLAGSAIAAEESHYVQCWAQGHSVRRKSQPNKDTATNARFAMLLEVDKDGGKAKELIGHVEVANFVEGNPRITVADYYSTFSYKNHRTSLSPRATKYKDDEYFRLRDISATETSTHHDGGGMNGYVVVSKKLLTAKGEDKFDAHYVLQAGDHFGGTIDYQCSKY